MNEKLASEFDAYCEEKALEHAKSGPLNDGITAIHKAGWAAGRRAGFDEGFVAGRSAISGTRVLAVWVAIAVGIALGVYVFGVTITWNQP